MHTPKPQVCSHAQIPFTGLRPHDPQVLESEISDPYSDFNKSDAAKKFRVSASALSLVHRNSLKILTEKNKASLAEVKGTFNLSGKWVNGSGNEVQVVDESGNDVMVV